MIMEFIEGGAGFFFDSYSHLKFCLNTSAHLCISKSSNWSEEALLVARTVKFIPPPALCTSIYEAPANFFGGKPKEQQKQL